MMTSEAAAVDAIAEKYRLQGYEVLFGTSRDMLPETLRHYQPDFVAVRGLENVAVEVKLQSALGADPDLMRTAELFRATPGWRLDLAVVDDGEPVTPPPLLSQAEIGHRLTAAEQASATGDHAGAVLLIWTALEAILRARMADADEDRPMPSGRLAKSAYSLGLFEAGQLPFLEWLANVRNEVVHGRKAEAVTSDDYERARQLLLQLIHEMPS